MRVFDVKKGWSSSDDINIIGASTIFEVEKEDLCYTKGKYISIFGETPNFTMPQIESRLLINSGNKVRLPVYPCMGLHQFLVLMSEVILNKGLYLYPHEFYYALNNSKKGYDQEKLMLLYYMMIGMDVNRDLSFKVWSRRILMCEEPKKEQDLIRKIQEMLDA